MQVFFVYRQPFRRNLLLKCMSQPKIAKKSLKPPILGVQGHSRSSMLTLLKSSSLVLVMISSMSVPICNHFQVKRANNNGITSFKGGAALSSLHSWGSPLPSSMNFCHEILVALARKKWHIGFQMTKIIDHGRPWESVRATVAKWCKIRPIVTINH